MKSNSKYKVLIFNVDEVWLKGGNRNYYLKILNRHIKKVLEIVHPHKFQYKMDMQRYVCESEESFSEKAIQRLIKIPGIHSLELVKKIESDFDCIFPAVQKELLAYDKLPATFKVETKRNDKTFPMGSYEVSREIGAFVLQNFENIKVNLHTPDLLIKIKILSSGTYICTQKLMAIGGLPVGMSGRVVTLLSGGFDSPVASYLMAKRGCDQAFIFFHAKPFVGDEVKDKIIDLVRVLADYQRQAPLYVIAFGEIQKKIAKYFREEYRTLIFRKAMVECANILAKRVSAHAIVMGDALGQVSSQTLKNIGLMDEISDVPILRPLIGYNKIEIINLAKHVGTHDISIIPHDDACAMFAPKKPITNPNRGYWDKLNLDITEELESALDNAEIYLRNRDGEMYQPDFNPLEGNK